MTESGQANGGQNSPTIDGYDDFYDLLGVSENADSSVIMDRSRKLLGKFHPDVSEHKDADQLFKAINRAQSVLTDDEQRTIYDRIGHESYVEKREEGGEMTLSENVNVNDDFEPNTPSTSIEDDGGSTVNVDYGSSSRNERNTQVGGAADEHNTYKLITNFDLELKPKELLTYLYRQMWLMRIAFVSTVGAALLYLWFEHPNALSGFWSSTGLPLQYGMGVLTILALVFTGVTTVIGTGLYVSQYMRSVEDDITLDDDEDDDVSKENARGVNTSQTRSSSSENAWDMQSRWDAAREGAELKNLEEERKNKSLTIGGRSLAIAIVLVAIGSILNGIHPWSYLELIVDGAGIEAALWWDPGNDGLRELAILVNAGGALFMFALALFGVVFTAHGLSKEAWHQRYFSTLNVNPTAWDCGIVGTTTAFLAALILTSVAIPNASLNALPTEVVSYLAATDGVSSLTIAVGSMTLLYIVYLLFGLRKKFV